MTRIEQIDKGNIILDFDEKLSVKDIYNILSENLEVENDKNPFICNIDGVKITLLVKHITYLGNPHKIFKKRIQISRGWQELLKNENTFLLGVYKYKETIIFTYFDKENFIKRITNNSSAHTSTFDLLKAYENGSFTKKDIRGNLITTIRQDKIKNFLKSLIKKEDTYSKEVLLFEDFKRNLRHKYHGKECYQEMIKANYSHKFQPEWVGFFLEYKFQNFLNNDISRKLICQYQSNKKKGTIDLDLNFNDEYLGDLKAHSNDSGAILGNDTENVNKALELYGKLWYIVFNHNTEKDDKYDFEVTKFWNSTQKKQDLMSYHKKMKNNIIFTDFKILEINNYNKQHLSAFNQGKNSNQKERKPKIKISNKVINNLLIYHSDF